MTKAKILEKDRAKKFDTIVIGGGLTGLLLAAELTRKGENIAIIDANDTLGGEFRQHGSSFGPIDHGLKLIPATSEALSALEFLRQFIPSLSWETKEIPPLTFEAGLKPFVGFGEKALAANDQVMLYAAAERLVPSLFVYEWVNELSRQIRAQIYARSFVTHIYNEGEQISGIQINGKENLLAARYVYCEQPQGLLRSSISHLISTRNRQKLAKAEFWTSISLDIFHSKIVTESMAAHVLWSPSETEAACVGVFQQPEQNERGLYQHSQWLTFVPYGAAEDDELSGNAIRKIKRQIKRAYPEALENTLGEIILVGPGSHGSTTIRQDDDLSLAPFAHLQVAGPQFEASNPAVGALLQAQRLIGVAKFTSPQIDAQAPNDLASP